MRRVSVARETHPFIVASALPAGHVTASSQREWLDAVAVLAEELHLRSDSNRTLLAIARQLAYTADWDTMTTRCTWSYLTSQAGYSRRTVARYLALLRGHELLGVVAHGRTAQYSPDGINEAAVYVLAVPGPSAVDEVGTPPQRSLVRDIPPHARKAQPHIEPLRGPELPAALARPPERRPDRHSPLWPSCATAQRKDDMTLAAAELQRRLPVLRRISDRHVRFRIRPYLEAGWTVLDLVWAIDHTPDERPWSHDGDRGVENVGAWLRYRLAAWHRGDEIRRSPSQVANAERARQRARQRAEFEAQAAMEQRVRAERDNPSPLALLAKAHCLRQCDPATCTYPGPHRTAGRLRPSRRR